MTLNFWALLLKMYIFEVVTFFSCLMVIQSTQFFSGSSYLWDSCFWWSIFPPNYQNAYNHQTFQVGDMLQGALTDVSTWHLNGVVLRGHVTNKIHILPLPAEDDWYHTRQGANLVEEAPKHDPLIKWPTWVHMTVWKIYISTFTRSIANKLGRLLTLGRIFITQTLKSSPTSCF